MRRSLIKLRVPHALGQPPFSVPAGHRSPYHPFALFIAGLMVTACNHWSHADDHIAQAAPVDHQLSGVDLAGRRHQFGATSQCRCSVAVFLSTQCPISNAAIPILKTLATKYKGQGVEFFGIISDPMTARDVATRHSDEYRIAFPVLFDGSLDLRRKLRPTHTPQAIVISPTGKVLYSGRINDRYAEVGRKKLAPRQSDLENALTAIVAGQPVEVPVTQPIGCLLEEASRTSAVGSVTYNRDIAPLLHGSCAGCHRPDEAAPFPLLTYEDACAHANQIAVMTETRRMPPWHPEPGFGHFRDERRLTDAEIARIKQWIADGKPEGDPRDRPTSPRFHRGWRLGKPDLILKMPERFELSADGPDVHQHFVLPTGVRQTKLVSAVEFRPGNPRVVHHASFYIDNKAAARKLDLMDPSVGYGSFSGPGFENYASLRSWLPGMSPQRLPRGMGAPLPANSDIVLEVHYRSTGKVETDQSTVGIFFAEPSAREMVLELQIMNQSLSIPPNEPRFHHKASYTLPIAATLLDAAPHMHLLGSEMKATAVLPDGEIRPLIWIRKWDFDWQDQYVFLNPPRLPAGTRLEVEAWYDNSSDNRLNPNVPPKSVQWGEQSCDEMGICHFRYKCDSLTDLLALNTDFRAYARRQIADRLGGK